MGVLPNGVRNDALMGSDFAQLYQSGADLWRGQYTGLYPLPMNGLFALLSLLPYRVALYTVMFGGLALFVAVLRRRALVWLWFYPVLSGVLLGQIDLIFFWLLRWASPVALALMTLKPQLFPLALPALLSDRAKWKPFVLACVALYGPVTLARPTWIMEWLRQCNDGRLDWQWSTSLMAWPLIGVAILLAVSAFRRLDWRAIFWTCNPTLRWYDFGLMAGGSLWLIPASWACWGLVQLTDGRPAAIALLGVVDFAIRCKGQIKIRPT